MIAPSQSQPTYAAVCVSPPFGTKRWLTFHTLYDMLMALPSIHQKNMIIHSFFICDDVVGCTIDYTLGGSLGTFKVFTTCNENDCLKASFFTEKYSPKTGNMFQCCIYEVDSTVRFSEHILRTVFYWIKVILPKCSLNESCKIHNMTCDMFQAMHQSFVQ
jgi:hypothetical protein